MDSRRRRQCAWLGAAFGTRAAKPPPAARHVSSSTWSASGGISWRWGCCRRREQTADQPRSRVPDECSERACASGTRSGTQRKNREAQSTRVALGPGSRCARPGHASGVRDLTCTASRLACEPLAVVPTNNVKQRSLLRSRDACRRPGGVLVIASTPIERWAERRQAHLCCCRACEARPPRW
jgi:hypothetical protein